MRQDDVAWELDVRRPAVTLGRKTMPLLSEFGGAISMFFLAIWGLDLASLPYAVATRNSFTVMMIGFFPFPLLMVVPMAIVSTSCDDLLDELNVLSAPDKLHPTPYAKDLREREGLPHEDYYKIESLLNYLKGLNTRQGLGFVLFVSSRLSVLKGPSLR